MPTLPRRTRHVKPEGLLRRLTLWRVSWARESSGRARSRRFPDRHRAERFAELLNDLDAQEEYGALRWVIVEVARGTIGPWRSAECET